MRLWSVLRAMPRKAAVAPRRKRWRRSASRIQARSPIGTGGSRALSGAGNGSIAAGVIRPAGASVAARASSSASSR